MKGVGKGKPVLGQELANLFWKDQMVHMSGLAGHLVPAAVTQICCCCAGTAADLSKQTVWPRSSETLLMAAEHHM